MKSRKAPSRGRRQEAGGSEWVGGCLTAPFVVDDRDKPYRPGLVLWVELPEGVVVGQAVVPLEEVPGAVGRTLVEAMERPLTGRPRRPARLRVADAATAREVREATGDRIPVQVAPTPELDALLRSLAEFAARDDEEDQDASYLEDGRIPAAAVAAMFEAARVLHTVAPWTVATDDQVLRMDIPALEVDGACVSIIGALGENLGLVIFPSLDDYLAFQEAAMDLQAGDVFPDPFQPSAGGPGAGSGPLDLGSEMLSLNFEAGADLPAGMRREVAREGWPVAAADAYPVVSRITRDAVALPLERRDLEIVTACALSVAAFFGRHPEAFAEDDPEPVCESLFDGDDREVRLTIPYESYPLFDLEAPAASAATAPHRPAVARNAPCPCGSGKKYKKCHLPIDEQEHRPAASPHAAVHERDGELVVQLSGFALAHFGRAWWRHEEVFQDADAARQLAATWSVYEYRVAGTTAVEAYLEAYGRECGKAVRAWLKSQQAAWLSIWEVTGVDAGQGLTLRDLLTGEVRDVHEESASTTLHKRDAILGRVVDHEGASYLCGVHPYPLPPREAAEVVRRARGRLRRKRAVPVERLRDDAVGAYLIRRWEEACEDLQARAATLPDLQNTDGDPVLLTVDHFDVSPGSRQALGERLAALPDVNPPEGDESPAGYDFLGPPGSTSPGQGRTVLGVAWLGDDALRLETNSIPRADRLRARLEEACPGLLRHRAREHADPLSSRAGPVPDLPEPPPGAESFLLEHKERYYREWLDMTIPALGDRTPREARRTASGRAALDQLLKEMENMEQRSPAATRYDFAKVRRELRLE